jgi:hypothetical protein
MVCSHPLLPRESREGNTETRFRVLKLFTWTAKGLRLARGLSLPPLGGGLVPLGKGEKCKEEY